MIPTIVWIAKVCVAVVTWAVTHWAVSIAVGVVLTIAGGWLGEQSFCGAGAIGSLLSGFGAGLVVAGSIGWFWSGLGFWGKVGLTTVTAASVWFMPAIGAFALGESYDVVKDSLSDIGADMA